MTAFDYPIMFFNTTDLRATATFYEGILGLRLVRDQGDCRIYEINPHAYIGFCQRETVNTTGIIICLVTNDVDEWYLRLQSHHITIEKPPSLNPKYNIYHCFLRDPNGYLVEIQRFLD